MKVRLTFYVQCISDLEIVNFNFDVKVLRCQICLFLYIFLNVFHWKEHSFVAGN